MALICEICGSTFNRRFSLKRHLKRFHRIEENENVIHYSKCLECGITFSTKVLLIDHLNTTHEMKIVNEKIQFKNKFEFIVWLENFKSNSNADYSLDTGSKTSKEWVKWYYNCCRSGIYREKSEMKKRGTKSQGTKKLNSNCTSHIILTEMNESKECSATIYRQHYGHETDLQHIDVPIMKKNEIAAKISQGVAFNRILGDIRNNISGGDLKRVDLVTRKDLNNIKQKFDFVSQDGQRHKDDATSVSIWVEEMRLGDKSPVVYYKKQGELDENGILKCDDFCIIIMNKAQEYMLKEYEKIVCIDGTHGLNAYDFELVTLLVVDEFGSGFPCCFMFSNLKDTKIYEVMFSSIKSVVGNVNPNVFMSDICDTFYQAWQNIMGPVPHRLLCSWHIDRAWKSNLNKIIGTNRAEKQSQVYKTLKILQSSTDEIKFKEMLTETMEQMSADADTRSFGIYFSEYYVEKPELWAYCYRKGLGINCNMHLESMHKSIKYHYLNGLKIRRLDKSIAAIMAYTRDKQVERLTKLTKGKCTSKIQDIVKRHNNSIKLKLDVKIKEEDQWLVHSENSQKDYLVQKVNDEECCPLRCVACKVCIHSVSCTCLDYTIKHVICKHIHYVAAKFLKTSVTATITNDSQKRNFNDETAVHLDTLKTQTNDLSSLYEQFQSKALAVCNSIHLLKSKDDIKMALQKMDTLEAFITMKAECEKIDEFKDHDTREPANKKIKLQHKFFSTKKKRPKASNILMRPSCSETEELTDILLKQKYNILNQNDNEHSYAKADN